MSYHLSPKEPWADIPAQAPLLRPADVMRETGLSRSSLYDQIARKKFPPFLKIGARASAMPKAWLDAYLQAQGKKVLNGCAPAAVAFGDGGSDAST